MPQQLVIQSKEESTKEGMAPLGSRKKIVGELELQNTAAEEPDGDTLWGPGIRIDLPPQDPITQMLLTIEEDEIAWLVIMRLARMFKWKLINPESGREFKIEDEEMYEEV